MSRSDRPRFDLNTERHIEAAHNQSDRVLWGQLQQLLTPTPSSERMYPGMRHGPPMGKTPNVLRSALVAYAEDLFTAEASLYQQGPRLDNWIHKLGSRILERGMGFVQGVEEYGAARQATLLYHGLSMAQMRRAMASELANLVTNWTKEAQSKPPLPPEVQEQIDVAPHEPGALAPAKHERLSASISSPRAAEKLVAYLVKHGIGLTAFAIQAQTTDKTLRSFRYTGKVRRDIFDSIAKAMGTTKEALLND
jgi:lambda repressor-like predicted transcriptional regulator